jgi:hypothetical protein
VLEAPLPTSMTWLGGPMGSCPHALILTSGGFLTPSLQAKNPSVLRRPTFHPFQPPQPVNHPLLSLLPSTSHSFYPHPAYNPPSLSQPSAHRELIHFLPPGPGFLLYTFAGPPDMLTGKPQHLYKCMVSKALHQRQSSLHHVAPG